MKLYLRTWLFVIVLSVLIEATQSNENETDSNEARRGRVYGRIVKLYSGIKPDPVLCDEEGFKADPADCSTFYRCVQSFGGKFNVYKFQCGPGTVYDPATEICNHPSNTKRSECRGPIVPVQHEIHENDIDFRELPSPISTITPLYLNTKINASKPFTISTVESTDKYADIRNSTSYTLTTNANQQFSDAFGYLGASWSNKYPTSSQVPSSSNKPSRSDNDPCTHDGFIGDSYNCKKFYRCVNNFRGGFIRYEFTCGDSTVWDDDKQSCNYAWDVRSTRCGRDTFDDNVIPMRVDQDNKVTSNYHYATTPNQNENIVTDTPNAINFGDKINNYYNSMTSESPIINSIDNNKPQITNNYNYATMQSYNTNTEKHPAENLFTENQYNSYNPQTTEKQINYGLTDNHKKVDEIKKDFTSHTTSTEYTPSSSTRENDSIKLFNNLCLESGFIGDPNDCQKFYRCVDSGRGSFTRYDFSCSQGTVWDSSIEACNHAWAVKGCGSKMSTQGLTTESNVMIPSSSMSINESQDNEDEDTDNDDGYLNQINQEHTKTTTPKFDSTFASTTSQGVSFDKACSESGFFKNTVDCKKFYKCIENGRGSFTRFDYNCGEGTLWDETIEACNHAWAVKSCKSSSDRHNDTGIMTTVTLVQTTTQKNIDTDDYDSIYGQSMPTPDTSGDLTTSTTSKETLNSNNRQCDRNGFMGDTEDCNKFYRCVENGHDGYIRYEFLCGDGTVWDPTIEACNHARDVEDCRSSSSNNIDDNNQEPIDSIEDGDNGYVTPSNKDPDVTTQSTVIYTTTPVAQTDSNSSSNICQSPGFMGDTESCEKFYRCVDNGHGGFSRIEFSCGEGTVWDSSIEACNHRWAVEKCGKGANNELSETTSHSVTTTTDDMSDTTTTTPTESHTSTQQHVHSDNKCTSEGFFGAESEDCKKFYRCVDDGKGGYTKYEFSCGDGTIWDESIQACNHATNDMTCGKGTPSSTNTPRPDLTSTQPTNSMPSTTSTSTTVHSTDYMPSTTPSSTSNTDVPSHDDKCTSEGFKADSSDCRKFYRCVDNGKGGFTRFEFSCGEGTVWIQEIQACDHDTGETNCNISKSTTTKTSTTVAGEFTTASTQGSTDNAVTATTLSTTEKNNIHKNESDICTSEGFYPNKNDCKRFYRCVDDGEGSYTKYEFTCAEGTAWDIQSQSCNYITEVSNCENNKIPQSETKPDPEDSSESGTQENMTTKKPLSTTASTRPKQNTCEEEGFFGDTEDCKKFYRCVSNEKEGFTKYEFTCGDGTIWDQDITACNHPQDVSNPPCKSDGSSSPVSSTSTTTAVNHSTDYTSAPESTSSPSTTSTTSTTVDGSSTTTKDTNSNCSNTNKDNTNNNNYTCPKAGYYADPNDCKKFYRCVDWENNGEKFSIFHFDCGDGTIWDPALETCNHEESVYPPRNCNGSQQQNQNNKETSSTTDISSETESTTSTYETTSTSTQTTTADTEPTTTTTQKSTTQSKPTTTTQKSTTQTSTTQSKPTTTTTTTTTTQKSTTQESTTTTTTTTEPSTQQTSTSREQSTTDASTQSTTESTTASNTEQTTSNKEPNTSEATTTNSDDTTAMTNQMSSTTEQSTTTTEVMTSTEEISPQTTDSQSSTTDSTTTTNAQESTTEGSSSSNKDCPETEDDQYLYVCPTSFKRHPKYCNMFYQCTDDNDNHEVKVAVFNCPNNTIYDESKIQCVEENKADKKCNGQISQRNRIKRLGVSYNEPVVVSGDSMACSTAGHFPFEKHEKCSPALLKCEYSKSGKLKGYVYRCPEGFVYWSISRRCEAIRKVRDCKRSSYPWNKRYDIPVESHNISL